MTKRLIIARHGNTFLPNETPTRVGRATDLPLVEEKRGRAIGKHLLSKGIEIDKAYAAPLQRTMQTAELALKEINSILTIISVDDFAEIDYGPDENKTESEVQLRLGKDYAQKNNIATDCQDKLVEYGKKILNLWDSEALVPEGWDVDVQQIIRAWHNFADNIKDGETVFLCSSNGIIRFAPYILDIPYSEFSQQHEIKVATGSISIFDCRDGKWTCTEWNSKPYKLF